jgi:hypothetical protein
MAKYQFTRPVYKDGTLTDYAEMLLDIKRNGGIEIVETRRRGKYMTYQHMFEFGLLDSVKQHGTRRHNYVLTQSGLDLVRKINRQITNTPTKTVKESKPEYKAGDKIYVIKKGRCWNTQGEMDYLVGSVQTVVNCNDNGEIIVQRKHANKGIYWHIKADEVRPATETEINSLVDIADIRLQFKKIKQLKDQLLLEEKKLEELLK